MYPEPIESSEIKKKVREPKNIYLCFAIWQNLDKQRPQQHRQQKLLKYTLCERSAEHAVCYVCMCVRVVDSNLELDMQHTRPQIYPFHYSSGFRAFAFNYSEFTVAHSSIHNNNAAALVAAAAATVTVVLVRHYHYNIIFVFLLAPLLLLLLLPFSSSKQWSRANGDDSTVSFHNSLCSGNVVGNCLNY